MVRKRMKGSWNKGNNKDEREIRDTFFRELK